MIKRRDQNQNEIVQLLRQSGCTVFDLSQTGNGVPDLLVSREIHDGTRLTWLVEVKGQNGKLNPLQREFRHDWQGHIYVIRDVDNVVDMLSELGIT